MSADTCPIQVDKGRLGKSGRGPIDIATPWRRPCILYAAGLGASEGPPASNLTHDRIWVFPNDLFCHCTNNNNNNNNNFRVSNIRVSNRTLIYNVCPEAALT